MNEPMHQADAGDVARLLETDCQKGLSDSEVRRRQERHGPNRIRERRGTPAWKRLLLQFTQPLAYILLIAAGVTAYLNQWVDSAVIVLVVVVNAVVGFIQESKAEKAIEALSKLVLTETTVRRDGTKRRVPGGTGSGRCGVAAIGRSCSGRLAPLPRSKPEDR